MLRHLCGLNRQDALQELRCLGIPSPDPKKIQGIRENVAIKVAGYSANQSSNIQNLLKELTGAVIIAPPGRQSADFIFYFSQSELPNFRRKLSYTFSSSIASFQMEIKNLLENISKTEWRYTLHDGYLTIDRPLIMGILNAAPDSFSDGGEFDSADAACRHAAEMLQARADIIDVGGESTRPGSDPVPLEEEWARIAPILKYLVKSENCIISVDTYKSEIARRALQEGAHIINDISAMAFDPQMAEVAAEFKAPVILMHLKGTPQNMQVNPSYTNLMEEITAAMDQRCRLAVEHGVKQLIVDPGVGFGKRLDDNFEILRRLQELCALGCPILLGISRKSFIGNLLDLPPRERVTGTVAGVLYGVSRGANILRVHDVREVKQSLAVYQAIQSRKAEN